MPEPVATKAPPQQPGFDPMALQFTVVPVQIGNAIGVMLQIAGQNFMSQGAIFTIEGARKLMYTLREGIDKAETTIVKPVSAIQQA